MRLTVSRIALSTLSISLLLAGCTDVYAGTGIRDPEADPAMVNTTLLDPGEYPTTPSAPLGNANTREAGKLAEARRMAEAVLVPFEVDPQLTLQKRGSGPHTDPTMLSAALYQFPEITAGVENHDFVTGFLSEAASQNDTTTELSHAVLRYGTAEDAAAAAADMTRLGQTQAQLPENTRRPDLITGRPEISTAAEYHKDEFNRLITYVPHGPFLIFDAVQSRVRDTAARIAVSAIDKQTKLLDTFNPTPLDKLGDLPIDPTGLLARTVPSDQGPQYGHPEGAYGTHGILHFMENPYPDQTLFTNTEMSAASFGLTVVYRARDYAGASAITDAFVAEIEASHLDGYTLDDPIPGMPAARCFKPQRYAPYQCVAAGNQYAITVSVDNPKVARQSLAAQYLMLTAK